MKSTVGIRKCKDYEPNELSSAIEAVLKDIGGLHQMIKRGDRVLLKPNLLMSSTQERAMVTHPGVVEAVARFIIDIGAKPFIGDSPPLGNLSRVLAKSG